ncbi:hypothetical protein WJX72_011888 [[Myrmecia] bisecta]|uniref:RRM domain-containing protein n=1 Tax=[Myrmecia] bisecta TaxID=41462 RepID=A0AAW1P1W3_9CHLO
MDDPPFSRVFIVCGRSVEASVLSEAFARFGVIQNVKVVRDKGVAFLKYARASSAALAIETMHEAVLNEGRGPMLKVMLAEAPNSRKAIAGRWGVDQDSVADPDNIPARSRLFVVVPKNADGQLIEEAMSKYPDLQYCKTDLIASKGIVFCKYLTSSSALTALEDITDAGMLAGYKVKCMLAEPKGKRGRTESAWPEPASPAHQPKGKRGRTESAWPEPASPAHQAAKLDYGSSRRCAVVPPVSPIGSNLRPTFSYTPSPSSSAVSAFGSLSENRSNGSLASSLATNFNAMSNGGLGLQEYSSMQGVMGTLTSLANLQSIAAMQGAANLAGNGSIHALGSGFDLLGLGRQMPGGLGGLGNVGMQSSGHPGPLLGSLGTSSSPDASVSRLPSMELSSATSRQRLFVVVHRSVTEDMLVRIFRMFPGMEYCDLKQDRATGQSKGFCYVHYSTPEAAAAALEQLNGLEFPSLSGHHLKVMYAEPIGSRMASGKLSPISASGTPRTVDSMESSLQHHGAASGEGSSQLPATILSDESMSGQSLEHRVESLGPSLGQSLEHRVEVAAVQNSLAHMCMPHAEGLREEGGHKVSRRASPASQESEAEWEAESGAVDERRLFTLLTRPLPDYALEHVFSKYGQVEFVRLQHDKRYGVVRMRSPAAARAALECLNGTQICGEGLSVMVTDPLQGSRNSKRPRVAE